MYFSKVRMPRSHRMTCSLPPAMIYSALMITLLDGVAQAALEQHGLVHLANGLEQLEVLHVAGTDLHHVHVLLKLRDTVLAHQLGDDGHAGGLAGLYHIQNALGLKALEGVGRGAGLVGTAAERVAQPAFTPCAMRRAALRHSMLQGLP